MKAELTALNLDGFDHARLDRSGIDVSVLLGS